MIKKKQQDINLKANFTFANIAGTLEKGSVEFKRVMDWLHETNLETKLELADSLIKDKILLKYKTDHNLVATTGLNVLSRLLAGDDTYTGEINYGAVGIGASPTIALGNTELTDEQFRTTISSQSESGTMAYIDFVFGAGDFDTTVIGQITEFGNFIDGEAGADTGQLFSDIATGGWDKNSTTSLFISCEYTLSNA